MLFFELNNWACGEDYPNDEPFLEWFADDLKIKFMDEQWVIENGLIVIVSIIDMSINFCVTAPDEWVEHNCPSLLENPANHKFLREPFQYEEDPSYGRFGCPFYSLDEKPAGIYFASEKEDNEGYLYYSVERWSPDF